MLGSMCVTPTPACIACARSEPPSLHRPLPPPQPPSAAPLLTRASPQGEIGKTDVVGWRAQLGMKDQRIDEQITRDYRDRHGTSPLSTALFIHEPPPPPGQLQSKLEMNDLETFMHDAEMAGRDFEAPLASL